MFNGLNAILYDLLYFVKVDTTLCPQIYSLFNPFIQVCLSMYEFLLGPGIKVCSTVGMDEIPPQPAENLLIPPPLPPRKIPASRLSPSNFYLSPTKG